MAEIDKTAVVEGTEEIVDLPDPEQRRLRDRALEAIQAVPGYIKLTAGAALAALAVSGTPAAAEEKPRILLAAATTGGDSLESLVRKADPLIVAELIKLASEEDMRTILSFDSVGDGNGTLPILPIAMKGVDGIPGTGDELAPPDWIRLRGILGNAQAAAVLAEGNLSLAKAEAAKAINAAIQRSVTN